MSPRLEHDTKTASERFPDFLDWPATLAQSTFRLHFGNGPAVPIAGNDTDRPPRIGDELGLPDSTVWKALFPPETVRIGIRVQRPDETRRALLPGRGHRRHGAGSLRPVGSLGHRPIADSRNLSQRSFVGRNWLITSPASMKAFTDRQDRYRRKLNGNSRLSKKAASTRRVASPTLRVSSFSTRRRGRKK